MATTEFNKYYYLIDIGLIDNTTNDIYNISDNLISMRIINNYTDNIFPIMEIQLSLNRDIYFIIRDDEVKFRVSIDKRIIKSTENNIIENTSRYEDFTVFSNLIFDIVDKNKIQYSNREMNEDVPSIEINFTLFYKEHLNTNKILINGNYLSCRVEDVLVFVNGINQNKLYIEKPHNKEVYDQIIVPPMNITKFPRYIQDMYGVYQDGINIFFDYNEYYIMNKNLSKKTPISKNDYRNVLLDIIEDDETNNLVPFSYGYKSANSDYYYIKTDIVNVHINNNDYIRQEIFGTKQIVLRQDSDLNINRVELDKNEEKLLDKTQVYYSLIDNVQEDDTEVHKDILYFNFSSLDMNTFKCNKIFKCNINNHEYNLRVSKVIFNFIKDKNSGIMTLNGVCQLKEN